MAQGHASAGPSGRIGVGVSGAGSNLRALAAAAERGELGGRIGLVFADRPCAALEWAVGQGLETALIPGLASHDAEGRAAADRRLAETLTAAGVGAVVLAGYMRIVGPASLAAFEGAIVNTHPALLPAFPGAHAVRDALAAGVKVTGCTVHVVDATLDGGPILAQEAVPVLPDDDEATLHDRIRRVEHRLLPASVARLLAGAISMEGQHTTIDVQRLDAEAPVPRRALLSVSDKTGLTELGRGLVALGYELVSTGGTARALRDAGLPVTDVSAVTGFPEMLDGRVKTLHPRIHAGVLADRRLAAHREALLSSWIAPFDLVVVNLYPFGAAVERPGITLDEVVEEIDIGGPSMVRAAAKNHPSVAVVTSPARYGDILRALDEEGAVPLGLRSALAVEAFRHTAAYDARIAEALPSFMDAAGVVLPDEAGLPRSDDGYPASLTIALEKVETLRYGENPHQPAARYRRPGGTLADGPFAIDRPPLQGKALSFNNVLDAAAADALARTMHGPACVIVKHTNPCGAAERPDLLAAWSAALEADPVSAFGGVVAVTREVDRALADALVSIFLEIVVAPGYAPDALEVLATKPNLRVLVDEVLAQDGAPGVATSDGAGPTSDGVDASDRPEDLDRAGDAHPAGARFPSHTGSFRTAGGAVLVTAPDTRPDDPADWACPSRREPTDRERADLDLAWRLCRGVTSNAIVLVRDGRQIGLGSGQTSRVDAARQAVDKARAMLGDEVLRGAVCASDAFFPFPDAVEVCLRAGVTAFVQPGGSINDAKTLTAVDAVGAAMLVTGTRHFRH